MLQVKLMEEYDDGVVFVTMCKKIIICFRGTGLKLINNWYTEKAKNKKAERIMRIVDAAATIIRRYLKIFELLSIIQVGIQI